MFLLDGKKSKLKESLFNNIVQPKEQDIFNEMRQLRGDIFTIINSYLPAFKYLSFQNIFA